MASNSSSITPCAVSITACRPPELLAPAGTLGLPEPPEGPQPAKPAAKSAAVTKVNGRRTEPAWRKKRDEIMAHLSFRPRAGVKVLRVGLHAVVGPATFGP